MEQSGLGQRRVVGGVCGAAGLGEFSRVCFLAELLQNTTLGFNLAELGLFAESWSHSCVWIGSCVGFLQHLQGLQHLGQI